MNGIRIIAYKRGDVWIAQCLDLDICVQSGQFNVALQNIKDTINELINIYGGIHPNMKEAPQRFFEMWDHTIPNYEDVGGTPPLEVRLFTETKYAA
jgi:hypothetical protein